jgi:AraC-like DNA-binding protein
VHYEEFAPAQSLASIVDCVWILEGDKRELAVSEQPVLPDGRPEIIVHFGDSFLRAYADGTEERQPSTLFAGQLTGPLLLKPTGRVSVLGVRFRPYGAAALLDVPQSELVGLTVGLDSVSRRLAAALEPLRDSARPHQAVAPVQSMLSRLVMTERVDPAVRSVADAMMRSGGSNATSALVRQTGLSPRHVQRRFLQQVGVPPKRLARIVRFTHALRTLETLEVSNRGTYAAVNHGYSDQAHFVRDFRAFAGASPTAHLLRHAELTGFFTRTRRGR